MPLPWTAKIDGLQQGRMQILATLEHNSTEEIFPGGMLEERDTVILAKTQVGFDVAMGEAPPSMQITYPRPEEHLSTESVDVAMRIGNFKPGAGPAGYFCATFVENIGDPSKERTHNKCIVPDRGEIVLSTSASAPSPSAAEQFRQ